MTVADFETVWRWARDPRVNAFVGGSDVWTEEFTRSRVAESSTPGGFREWFIATDGDAIVGMGALMRPDDSTELGYWVDPDHWGRGIAGSILAELVAIATEEDRGLPLSAKIQAENTASARVAERAGFILHATGEEYNEYRRAV